MTAIGSIQMHREIRLTSAKGQNRQHEVRRENDRFLIRKRNLFAAGLNDNTWSNFAVGGEGLRSTQIGQSWAGPFTSALGVVGDIRQ